MIVGVERKVFLILWGHNILFFMGKAERPHGLLFWWMVFFGWFLFKNHLLRKKCAIEQKNPTPQKWSKWSPTLVPMAPHCLKIWNWTGL